MGFRSQQTSLGGTILLSKSVGRGVRSAAAKALHERTICALADQRPSPNLWSAAWAKDFVDGVLPYSTGLKVKYSKLHGNGVYAKKAFKEGEMVEFAPSVLLMNTEMLGMAWLWPNRFQASSHTQHIIPPGLSESSPSGQATPRMGGLLADYRYSAESLREGLFRSLLDDMPWKSMGESGWKWGIHLNLWTGWWICILTMQF